MKWLLVLGLIFVVGCSLEQQQALDKMAQQSREQMQQYNNEQRERNAALMMQGKRGPGGRWEHDSTYYQEKHYRKKMYGY